MPLADYNILFNTPAVRPVSSAEGAVQGIKDATTINYQNALTKNAQLQNSLNQMQAVNNLAGSVAFAPPEQQAQVYQSALAQAKSAGLDTTALPPQWGPDAQSAVQAAYYNSGMALQRMKTEAELGMLQSTINYRNSLINKNNFDQGAPASYTPTGGASIFANPNLPASSLAQAQSSPVSLPSTVSTPVGNINIGSQSQPQAQQQVTTDTNSQQQNGNPAVPVVNSGLGSDAAALAGNKKNAEAQADAWNKFKAGFAGVDANYLQTQQKLDVAESAAKSMPYTAPVPIYNNLINTTRAGQRLNLLGDALNLDYIGSLAKNGIGRMDLPLVKAAQFLAPGTDKYEPNNILEINRMRLVNELGHAVTQTLPAMEASGLRDPSQALKIVQDAVKKTGAIGKDGSLDMDKFNTWKENLPSNIKSAYDKLNPSEAIGNNNSSQSDQFKSNDVFVAPNGSTGTYDQLQEAAKSKGMSVDQFMQATGLKKKLVENQTQQAQANQPVNLQDLPGYKLAQSVVPMESGGNYNALGPVTRNGDRALGKYQVMASNVRDWTKEVLGKALSPQQFLSNPQVQDLVASVKMEQYFRKFGNPQDVFAMWHSGRPFAGNTRVDQLGTSTHNYALSATRMFQNLTA